MDYSLFQKEQTIKFCLECGSEMKQFFLPLYRYENKFCEQCGIDDYEGKCYCNEIGGYF